MTYGRIVLSAVAATVAYNIFGFLVFELFPRVADYYRAYPGVFRSKETMMGHFPIGMAGMFVAILVMAVIYAKGYEGGSGLSEGVRFGLLFGFFGGVFYGSVNYGVLIINKKLALMLATAGFFEFLIVGTVIGLVYQPGTSSNR